MNQNQTDDLVTEILSAINPVCRYRCDVTDFENSKENIVMLHTCGSFHKMIQYARINYCDYVNNAQECKYFRQETNE